MAQAQGSPEGTIGPHGKGVPNGSGTRRGDGGRDASAPGRAGVEKPSVFVRPLLHLIRRHREEWTHYDGNRCPLYPTCSAWGDEALRREPFIGFLLLVDRLFYRETGDLYQKYMHTPRSLSRHLRYYDPLEDSLPLWEEKRPSLYKEEFPE